MRRIQPWIGLPVVDEKTGREKGSVEDVLFVDDTLVHGLLLRHANCFRSARELLFSDISTIGPDAVMIRHGVAFSSVDLSDFRCLNHGSTSFCGKMLYLTDGTLYGELADVYLEENSGKIVGYEVSDGLFSDLLHGRRYVPNQYVEQIGESVLITHRPDPIPQSVHS